MSVMNGFRTELTQKILGFNSHVTVKPYAEKITDRFHLKLKEEFKDAKIIKTLNGEAVIMINELAKGILIRGIEKKDINDMNFFENKIIDGKLSDFSGNNIVIG